MYSRQGSKQATLVVKKIEQEYGGCWRVCSGWCKTQEWWAPQYQVQNLVAWKGWLMKMLRQACRGWKMMAGCRAEERFQKECIIKKEVPYWIGTDKNTYSLASVSSESPRRRTRRRVDLLSVQRERLIKAHWLSISLKKLETRNGATCWHSSTSTLRKITTWSEKRRILREIMTV